MIADTKANSPFDFRDLCLTSLIVLLLALTGCGKSVSRNGTEQLLTSNAVDRVVAKIDFTPLAGQRVYFNDEYINDIKGIGFVNGDYIISSLRQQIVGANCLLQDSPNDADYIIEARVGALGNDHHEVSYGVPSTSMLTTASAMIPTAPTIPTIPEISLAKKEHQTGAAKIGVFAYHRESKEPVWQAGVTSERSRSRESWLLGIGPLQSGTIYEGPMFAGVNLKRPIRDVMSRGEESKPKTPVQYEQPHMFPLAKKLEDERTLRQLKVDKGLVEWANHEDPAQINSLLEQTKKLQQSKSNDKK